MLDGEELAAAIAEARGKSVDPNAPWPDRKPHPLLDESTVDAIRRQIAEWGKPLA